MAWFSLGDQGSRRIPLTSAEAMNVLKSNVLETQIYYQEEGTKLAILATFWIWTRVTETDFRSGWFESFALFFFFFLVGTCVAYELINLIYLKDSWLDLLCNAFNLPSSMNWVLRSEESCVLGSLSLLPIYICSLSDCSSFLLLSCLIMFKTDPVMTTFNWS